MTEKRLYPITHGATALSSARWTCEEWTWGEFAERCADFSFGAETYTQYIKAKPKDQLRWKDSAGGYIAGMCAGGSRKKNALINRSMICLDIDFAPSVDEFWERVCRVIPFKKLMYSTAKHCDEKPRLRLVIPLAEDITPEQYEPVARMIAYKIGIDMFDDTTYQCSRLMYFAHVPREARFVFKKTDSDDMPVEWALKGYFDWTDVTEWPTSSRATDAPRRSAEKAENPTEKKGIVGAFCRAYSIVDAIAEFLADKYTQAAEGRYTYTQGTTFGGAVVYDDLFLYSHHSTDPVQGRLMNAFDLVRVHKFGHLDEGAKEECPVNKLPSYTKMAEFAGSIDAVRADLAERRLLEFKESFEELPGVEAPEDDSWKEKLNCDQKGAVYKTIANCVLIIENAIRPPIFTSTFGGDDLMIELNYDWTAKAPPRKWNSDDENKVIQRIEVFMGSTPVDMAKRAIAEVFSRNRRNLVTEALTEVSNRYPLEYSTCETALIHLYGCEDTPRTRMLSRKTAIAAVKRAFEPGCEVQTVLTLTGAERIGKSKLIKILGNWRGMQLTSDSFTFASLQHQKDAFDTIRGKWIVEIPELQGLSGAAEESVKAFISKGVDSYRPAYGQFQVDIPRTCIFIATTNEERPLRTTTGNRRFWVVDCPGTEEDEFEKLEDDFVDKYWASAVNMYLDGESPYLSTEEYYANMEYTDEHFEEVEDGEYFVREVLERGVPEGWESMTPEALSIIAEGDQKRTRISVADVWIIAMKNDRAKMTRSESYYIGRCIRRVVKKMRWKYTVYRQGNRTVKGFQERAKTT